MIKAIHKCQIILPIPIKTEIQQSNSAKEERKEKKCELELIRIFMGSLILKIGSKSTRSSYVTHQERNEIGTRIIFILFKKDNQDVVKNEISCTKKEKQHVDYTSNLHGSFNSLDRQ